MSKGKISVIKEYAEALLERYPASILDCARISSLLGTTLIENEDVSLKVVAGNLDVYSNRVFTCKGPIPSESEVKTIWDGHVWIVLEEIWILDVTIVRTAQLNGVSGNARNQILRDFSEGYVLSEASGIRDRGYTYKSLYTVDQKMQDGLIKSLGKKS